MDALLAAEKELAGDPTWRRPNRATEQARLSWPVLVNGIVADCFLAATIYPEDRDLRFTITFNCHDKNVWRLDFEPWDRIEMNPFLPGHPLSGATIRGPHCHPWEENRRFGVSGRIPDELPMRIPLPNIRSWDSAFRHVLGETNIRQPAVIPPWPPRERFL